jgi:ribosomal protein L37AE/L43A
MICEICKKKIRKPSKTPEEAMKKFALKLKKENEKIKKEKNGTSK